MLPRLKPLIGRTLLTTCEQMPWTKPWLRRWGLRTSQEWFQDRVVTVQLPEGQQMRLGGISENYLTFELFWRGLGYYEPITMLLTRELVRGGGIFYDVGANVGVYSLAQAILEPRLQVVAFEPNPKASQLLRANVNLNRLDRITCESVAVSDGEGKAFLHLCPSDMSASLEEDFEVHTGGQEVQRTSLDAYWEAHRSPARLVMKVDVEGHESAVFRGAADLLEERKPDLVCEVTGPLRDEVTDFLFKLGYRFYAVTNEGLRRRDELGLVVRDDLLFLNYLFTTASPAQVRALFTRIEPAVQALDLAQTSKKVAPEMIARLQAREGVSRQA